MFGREHNQKSLVCEKKIIFEGALSNLRQFLATKSLLKTMKNAFYFTLTALLVFRIFKFLS